jgi:hypothetical protein
MPARSRSRRPSRPNPPGTGCGPRWWRSGTGWRPRRPAVGGGDDLLLWLRGAALADLAGKTAELSEAERTATFTVVDTAGHLFRDGGSFVELAGPGSAAAQLRRAPFRAGWLPSQGVAVRVHAKAHAGAKVHLHLRPIRLGGGFGTTVGLVGDAETAFDCTLGLRLLECDGRKVALLLAEAPCPGVETVLRTNVGSSSRGCPPRSRASASACGCPSRGRCSGPSSS